MSSSFLKTFHTSVFKPMVLYGSRIWGEKAHLKYIHIQLRVIQRPFLIKITKAYRTTSNAALEVLSSCPPLSLEATRIFDTHKLSQDDPNLTKTVPWEKRLHPASRKRISFL